MSLGADQDVVGRFGSVAVFDTRRQQFELVSGYQSYTCIGGYSSVSYPTTALTHALLQDVGWSQQALNGPPAQIDEASAVYDSLADRIWLIGGGRYANAYPFPRTQSNTLCAFDPAAVAWTTYPASGAALVGVDWPQLAFDLLRRRLIVVGGRDSSGTARSDVHACGLSSPGVWSALSPTGGPPSPRYGGCAVYDPDSDRVVLIAGKLSASADTSDTWALELAGGGTWRRLATTGTPPSGRCWGALDRRAGQVLVVSGSPAVMRALDLRTLQWSLVDATGAPTFGSYAITTTSAFDAATRRFVLAWPQEISTWCHGPTQAYTFVGTVSFGPTDVPSRPAPLAFALGAPSPDPARGHFALAVTNAGEGAVRLEAYDIAGRRWFATTVAGPGTHDLTIDATGVPPGLAFVRASRPGRSIVRRVVLLP